MARTRAQDSKDSANQISTASRPSQSEGRPKPKGQKRQHHQAEEARKDPGSDQDGKSPSKKLKTADSAARQCEANSEDTGVNTNKLDALLDAYGALPLQDSGLVKVDQAMPETILALVYLSLLTSARISHVLAYESVKCLLEAGYHDLATLKKSTWQERTEVLTKGGYTRYREKTATALGELAEFIEKTYGGDLNNLLLRADCSPPKVRELLQQIKGIGKVGIDIFFDSAQGVWPSLAPFVDPRSIGTAERCGLGSSVESMWEAVGRDPFKMCKLSSALTMVRLDKKENDFK